MNTVINTFIFDCFGVLCEPVLNGWYKDNRLKQGFIDENLLHIFEQFDLGFLSEEDIVDYFSKYEGVDSTKEKIRKEIDEYLKIDATLVAVIRALKQKGFKTALLSNANASFFERKVYVDYPEFKNLFDDIVISSSVGMVKPNRDIYEYALQKIGSKPTESLFIDDSKVNVDAAIALNIQGFVYTDNASFVQYMKELGIDLNG